MINKAFDIIVKDPFGAKGVSPIKTMPQKYKYRVGGLRILFGIDREKHIIKVYAITPRGQAYKKRG